MSWKDHLKFYFSKYFFLLFAVAQWVVGAIQLYTFPVERRRLLVAAILFSLGSMFASIFFWLHVHLRIVSLSPKQLVIFTRKGKKQVRWEEIKRLDPLPFFNLLQMKVKGEKKKIYFFNPLPVPRSSSAVNDRKHLIQQMRKLR